MHLSWEWGSVGMLKQAGNSQWDGDIWVKIWRKWVLQLARVRFQLEETANANFLRLEHTQSSMNINLSLLKLWKAISKRGKTQRGKVRMENGNRPSRVFEANEGISEFTLRELGDNWEILHGKEPQDDSSSNRIVRPLFSRRKQGRGLPWCLGVRALHFHEGSRSSTPV